MAITFVNSSTGSASAGVALSMALPAGMAQDDVVYAVVNKNNAGSNTITSSGWSLLYDLDGATNHGAIYRKVMGASPDASIDFSNTSGGKTSCAIALRGADTATPEDAAATDTSGSASAPDNPSITTVTDLAWVLACVARSATNDGTVTNPSGYSNQVISATASGTCAISTKQVSPAGAENPAAWTNWTNSAWATVTIAVRPATTSTAQPSNLGVLMAAALAAYAITADNGFVGGRAPYEPRHLSPSLLDVRVDRPAPQYSPSLEPVIWASWPKEPDPLPQTTRKLPQGARVDDPTPRYSPAIGPIIAAWKTDADPLPQYTRKLVQPAIVYDSPPPHYSLSLNPIIASWPREPEPLPILPPKIVQGLRVDSPPTRYAPSAFPVIAAWPRDADPLPITSIKLPQGSGIAVVNNPPWRYSPSLASIIAAWPSIADPLPVVTGKRLFPPSVDRPPIGRRADRILPQTGDWSYETFPQYTRKLVQPAVGRVPQTRGWLTAVIESWKPQEQAQPVRRFVPIAAAGKTPFSRNWLAIVRASWDVPEVRSQRAPFFVPSAVIPPPPTPAGPVRARVTGISPRPRGSAITGIGRETVISARATVGSTSAQATVTATSSKPKGSVS